MAISCILLETKKETFCMLIILKKWLRIATSPTDMAAITAIIANHLAQVTINPMNGSIILLIKTYSPPDAGMAEDKTA